MTARHHKNLKSLVLAVALCAYFVTTAMVGNASPSGPLEQVPSENANVRLRISWGGGTAKAWQGNIHFHDAAITNPAVLGMNIESPAGLDIQQHAIRVNQLIESTYEGVELDVSGSLDSKISIRFSSLEESVKEIQLTLSDILEETRVYPLDDTSNRISFERAVGDQIRLTTDRPHMIFSPEEAFEFQLQANCVADGNQETQCKIEIMAIHPQQVISETTISMPCSSQGTSESVRQLLAVPGNEGVYQVRFSLIADAELGILSSRRLLATRTIQLVVLEDRPFARNQDDSWETELEVEPTDLRQTISPQVNQLSRLVGVGKRGALGKFSIIDHPDSSVVLPVGGWQSISIDIEDPGAKHMIELDYDGQNPMSLGMSVLVPDQQGTVSNFGFDSGFSVEDAVVGAGPSGTAVHRFTFWPESKQVVLLVANRDSQREARYKKIRLLRRLESKESEPVAIHVANDEAIERRSLMVIYEQPLFAENFGVHIHADGSSGQPASDWSTLYEGAKRLVSHLHDIGAGGAFMNVVGEGSTLAPLESMISSPRYDTGVFSTSIREMAKKDVVELLYRLFERENLRFVPLLTFDFPIASVEFSNAADSMLLDYRGRKRLATEYELPQYNPLSPTVRSAVNSIIEEFTSRYSDRAGYCGIALACRPDTYTLLPGSRHAGYDLETIERFQQDQEITDSSLSGNELLSAAHVASWISWRSSQMSSWYQELARLSSKARPDARFYLALIDLSRNEEFSSVLAPALHHSPDISQTMARMGLQKELTEDHNKIVLMKPHRYAPVHPLSSQKSEFEMQYNSQFVDWFGQNSASLFYNRSAWARFENLENSSQFSKNPDPIIRLQQLSRAGRWNCQPLAQALLENDSRLFVDGGLLLNTTHNRYRKEFLRVYSQLTDRQFTRVRHRTHANEKHPVAVGYLNTDQGTEIYLVNASPWKVRVLVKSNQVFAHELQNFGRSDWLPIDASNRPNEIEVTLNPFELVGGRVPHDRIKLTEFTYTLPESAQRDLNASYYKLRAKLIASGNAKPLDCLSNSGFEKQSLAGWTIGNQMDEFATVDPNASCVDGNCALRLKNSSNRNLWIRSQVIEPPETGRLSISVWLKLGDDQQQPPLRISVESDDPKSNYYRFAEVGSLTTESSSSQLSNDWRRFAVHFDDLPQQPLTGLRIGFDLIGPGDVWVDHVQIFDRWLDENDSKAVTQLLASIGPLLNDTETLETCRTLLRGYWPTFLREYFPDDNRQQTVAETPKSPVRSTMRQRFRRFVSPGIFQFR